MTSAPVIAASSLELEKHFEPFRRQVIGADQMVVTPYGEKRLVYADWTASGRLYRPIEDRIANDFGPWVGNTHSESNTTGTMMTHAYDMARAIIKKHVNANEADVCLTVGSGMTGAISKFQRILGVKVPDRLRKKLKIEGNDRPVVFITHMEHHSNQTTWLETVAEVITVEPAADGQVSLENLETAVKKYADRAVKIGAFTACSNVTGIETPVHEMAKVMHRHGGWCFIDFAASAPYVKIDMHPEDPGAQLDAIYFSPHKFVGGPGASGVLVFNSRLYENSVPDEPGGGTVRWTNPWGRHRYIENIEVREDGGTPPFLQAIRAALAVQVKEQLSVSHMRAREAQLVPRAMKGLAAIPGVSVMADLHTHRLGIVSFYIDHVHYNLAVKLLNDQFGIQVRGGCSCAGTYGHYLLNVGVGFSKSITDKIDRGDQSEKPGWVRLSVHPMTTDAELDFLLHAIGEVAAHGAEWSNDYDYDGHLNEFRHKRSEPLPDVSKWFAF